MIVRLNLGCGPVQPDNWVNVDPDPQWNAMYPKTLEVCEFPAESFDVAVVNHVLMMVPWFELLPLLVEIRRVLRAGGVLRIIEPDLIGAFAAWRDGDTEYFPIDNDIEETVDGKLCVYLTQAGATRSVFTVGALQDLCERAGFRATVVLERGETTLPPEYGSCELDSRIGESVFVEARR